MHLKMCKSAEFMLNALQCKCPFFAYFKNEQKKRMNRYEAQRKNNSRLGTMAYTYDSSTWEAGAGDF